MRDFFFKIQTTFGLDVKALDIHRGRYNGLPRYNQAREHCNLPRAKSWDDYAKWMPQEVNLSDLNYDI